MRWFLDISTRKLEANLSPVTSSPYYKYLSIMIRVKAPILQLLLAVTLLLHSAVARPPSPGRHAYHPIRSVAYKPWELAQFHLDPFQLTHMCIECKKNIWDSLLGCEIQCELHHSLHYIPTSSFAYLPDCPRDHNLYPDLTYPTYPPSSQLGRP